MTPNELLLKEAFSWLGLQEKSGPEDDSRLVSIIEQAGFKWLSDKHGDDFAWCSVFLNYLAKQCGLERSKRASARSWLEVGTEISSRSIEPGDVAVLWRENRDSSKGHVGLYLGHLPSNGRSYIYLLGGNQSDAVKISSFPEDRVLSYRRLKHV